MSPQDEVDVGAVWHYTSELGSIYGEVVFMVVDNRNTTSQEGGGIDTDATILILHTTAGFRVPVGVTTWWPTNYLLLCSSSNIAKRTMRRIA